MESRREILSAAGWTGPPSRWQSSAATLSSAFLLALAAPQTLQPHPFSTGHGGGRGPSRPSCSPTPKPLREKNFPPELISVRKLMCVLLASLSTPRNNCCTSTPVCRCTPPETKRKGR
ncbi:hypothetical protein CFAM422_003119 [Trichoderma lentiforme]|uniref:Uncharacterized protein n=1 Tax=Trichoderma lentiforme TaxID=1567552 RepID=A0A9P5CHG9_9HYPO|nr:hypothetical protein CFAM422_003119 [Trichoderma lentiforme]